MSKRKRVEEKPDVRDHLVASLEDLSLAARRIENAEHRAEERQAALGEAKQARAEAREKAREAGFELELALRKIPEDPADLAEYFMRLRTLRTAYVAAREESRRAKQLLLCVKTELADLRVELEKVIDDQFTFLPLFDREPEASEPIKPQPKRRGRPRKHAMEVAHA